MLCVYVIGIFSRHLYMLCIQHMLAVHLTTLCAKKTCDHVFDDKMN